jgi:lipoprotein-releasing system permease protein
LNLPLFIARRYFFSGRKKNFINIISILSVLGLTVSTAALIIALSVFNGFKDLLQDINKSFDPELKIEATKGKSFEVTDLLIDRLERIPDVEIITEVIEDYVYVRYRGEDIVVTLKGVGESFINQHRLDDKISQGKLILSKNGIDYAIVGQGVKNALSLNVEESIYPLQIFYINSLKSQSLNPSQLYSSRIIQPGGVFSIQKGYDDNFIFVPLHFAQDLLNYANKRTSIEIKTRGKIPLRETQIEIKKVLGSDFSVLSNDEQNADLYRILKIEKFFTFLVISLLALIISINIYFSLMMLVLDKRKDISVLFAMGSNKILIRRIFLFEGAIIGCSGTFYGLILGAIVCWLQDTFGLVGIGMDSAIIAYYPVKMEINDFILAALSMIAITFLVSFYPARVAARSYSIERL